MDKDLIGMIDDVLESREKKIVTNYNYGFIAALTTDYLSANPPKAVCTFDCNPDFAPANNTLNEALHTLTDGGFRSGDLGSHRSGFFSPTETSNFNPTETSFFNPTETSFFFGNFGSNNSSHNGSKCGTVFSSHFGGNFGTVKSTHHGSQGS